MGRGVYCGLGFVQERSMHAPGAQSRLPHGKLLDKGYPQDSQDFCELWNPYSGTRSGELPILSMVPHSSCTC